MRDRIDWVSLGFNIHYAVKLSEIADLGRHQDDLLEGIAEQNRDQIEAVSKIHDLMQRQEEKALP